MRTKLEEIARDWANKRYPGENYSVNKPDLAGGFVAGYEYARKELAKEIEEHARVDYWFERYSDLLKEHSKCAK